MDAEKFAGHTPGPRAIVQQQILARIDATPHRPPTFPDLVRVCGLMSDTAEAISELLTARLIDTETGDGGLTYRRKKAAYVEPVREPAKPLYANLEGVTQWPKRNSAQVISLAANCSAKQKARVEETKAKFRKILATPMTIKNYAKAANSSIYAARNLVAHYYSIGFLTRSGDKPCLYRVK